MPIKPFGKEVRLFAPEDASGKDKNHGVTGVKAYDASKWGTVRKAFAKATGVFYEEGGKTYYLNKTSLCKFLSRNQVSVESKKPEMCISALKEFIGAKRCKPLLELLKGEGEGLVLKKSDLKELFCNGFDIPENRLPRYLETVKIDKTDFVIMFMRNLELKYKPEPKNESAKAIQKWVDEAYVARREEIANRILGNFS